MIDWLVTRWQWPAAALFGAILLLALAPAFAANRDLLVLLVYLQLPAYFLHQYEEHRGDRFRAFVNSYMFGGVEALPKMDAFLINFIAVWILDVIAVTLATLVAPGWGLLATDLAVLNAIAHIAIGIKRRAYNPGLWTSLVLFIPLGGGTAFLLTTNGATATQQIAGIIVALLIHAAIVGIASVRASRLRAGFTSSPPQQAPS